MRVKPKGIRPPSLQVEPEKFQLTVINDSGKPQTFELRNHNGTVKAIMEINPGRTAIVGLNLPLDEYQLLAVDPKTLIHVNKSTLTFQTVAGSSTRNQGLRP
ncbi:hypothetical protein HYR54_03650 [Candidatus Acetothermia bacterium]|nr:hypothetical protein [Candidatus Acetothermia bacterium]